MWLPVSDPEFFARVSPWFMAMPHSRTLGLQLLAASRRKVVMGLPFREELIGNPLKRILHGGVVTSLIDTCSAASIYTLLDAVEAVATLDLRIDYLRPASPDATLYCEAECYRLTDNIAFTRATAYQDDPARPIAHGVATFARSPVPAAVAGAL
ncbi:PaaI family thioesterase [Chitinilyticum piscinae]|uniref:PaaI family thioesterase n=1 Tax=Chitinilyticum piscinae TaxID=2866724 RepID=A0A8J7K960_9NEIS|nr:PaaI family thioesterase [Chitinilyticum piscinae]MBE9610693.1 PaaI family thioesterase [Chitinilyticum piscinae]